MMNNSSFPEHWQFRKLHELCTRITDGTHKTPTYIDNGIPFLRVKDIHNDVIDWNTTKKISLEEHTEITKRCSPEFGDVLLSKNGTIGVTKVVDWKNPFSIFVSLCLLKPKHDLIDSLFLKFFLNSPLAVNQFRKRSKTATVTNLHLEEIREVIVPLPPLEEQQRIVSKLHQIVLAVNQKVNKIEEIWKDNLRLIIGKNNVYNVGDQSNFVRNYYRSVIDKALEGKLITGVSNVRHPSGFIQTILNRADDRKHATLSNGAFGVQVSSFYALPENWIWARIEDLATKEDGSVRMGPFGSQLKKKEIVSKGIRVLGIENVVNNRFELADPKFITREKYETLKGFTVKPRDVLISMMGTVGRSAVVPDDLGTAIFSSHLLRITLDKAISDPDFVSFAISHSSLVAKQIRRQNRGVVMDGMNTKIVKSLVLPLPPLSEQRLIVSKIKGMLLQREEIISRLNCIVEFQQKSKMQLTQVLSGILDKAFTGQVLA